jgi:hypothetical protein
VALPVIGVLNVLDMADGDQFEFVLALTISAVLDRRAPRSPAVVGAHHRALVAISKTRRAISELDAAGAGWRQPAALRLSRRHAHVRAGNFAEAEIDMQTSVWGRTAQPAYFSGGSTAEEALENVETVTKLRPDDWFAYFAWESSCTPTNNPDAAQALLDQSIALVRKRVCRMSRRC